MEKLKKQLAILNLTGELVPELKEYFIARKILVVNPLESNDEEHDWTHILTKDIHDFDHISNRYETLHLDRKIISLTKVNNLQNFTLNSGNMIFHDSWLKNPMGNFILDKYFQGYGGISLGDNYPTFAELGSFNVVNPFHTGDYLDRLVQKAFEAGAEALSLKTYFDHILMFLAHLKNKGKAGLPFEITFGTFEDIFAVQIHFFSNGLEILDVLTSLSPIITKKPEEYYLHLAVQAVDFFDFSFMPEVNKVVITGLWTKEERIAFENRGLMFSTLEGAEVFTNYKAPESASDLFASDADIKDFSSHLKTPAPLSDEVSDKVKLFRAGEEDSSAVNVSGGEVTKDEMNLIKGSPELDDLIQKVTGNFKKEDKSSLRLSGGELDPDKAALVIANNLQKTTAEKNLQIRSLGGSLPDAIKSGLFDFAKGLDKDIKELDDSELEQFQQEKVGEIVQQELHQVISGGDHVKDEIKLVKGSADLRALVQHVKGKFDEEDKTSFRVDGEKLDVEKVVHRIASNVDKSAEEKNFKVRALGAKLPDAIKTGLFDFAKGLDKNVDELKDDDLERFQLQKMPEIIQNELQKQIFRENPQTQKKSPERKSPFQNSAGGVSNEVVKQLESKLLTANSDNEKLKTQLKAMTSEVRILKESRNKLAELQMKATQAAAEVSDKKDDPDEELRFQFMQKLDQQKTLNDQEMKKLAALLERESKLIASAKEEEMKARRLQLEIKQKETLFAQELEKAERQLKGKDLILVKSKETFTKMMEKKETEIHDMKVKLDQVTRAMASAPTVTQTQTIRDLEKQNQNLNRQIEVYKVKISSLAVNLQPNKSEEVLKDELRKVQMQGQQMKNHLDFSKKEIEKLQAKASADNSQIMNLKQEKAKLEQLLKKAALEAKETTAQAQNNSGQQDMKRLQLQNQALEAQLKDSLSKITALDAKLADALKPQKGASGNDESKVKVTQLENSVKKLTQDLVESRNLLGEAKKDTNKLRQEKTALQNQLDRLKKEADKAKATTQKKPGGKAA